MSTRTVNAPVGPTGQYAARQQVPQVVPLSVFFLRMQGKDVDSEPEGEPSERKKKKKRKVSYPKQDAMRPGDQGQTVGGDDKTAAAAGARGGESTAEGMGGPVMGPTAMGTGAPSKVGASHASTGATGTGNVAAYPVPIGGMLRRVMPSVAGKKKRKRTREERRQMIAHLVTV